MTTKQLCACLDKLTFTYSFLICIIKIVYCITIATKTAYREPIKSPDEIHDYMMYDTLKTALVGARNGRFNSTEAKLAID